MLGRQRSISAQCAVRLRAEVRQPGGEDCWLDRYRHSCGAPQAFFEFGCEQCAGAMEAGTNRAYRTIQLMGYLRVIQPFQITQHHHFAVVGRQAEDGGLEFAEFLIFCDRICGFDGEFAAIRDEPADVAQVCADHVASHADEIGLQIPAGFSVLMRTREQAEKNILHHFFSGFKTAGHMQSEAKDGTLVTPVKGQERVFPALSCEFE